MPLAWLSGLLVYSNLDGRWGRLPWRIGGDWIDLHGSTGVLLWPVALLALALAVGSGKLMQEDWLRQGELDHWVYGVHLVAWLAIALCVAVHVEAVLQRGGLPLARSMASWRMQANDQPRHWIGQVRRALGQRR